MTQLERADLHAAIETRYPDNTTEDITPLRLREGLHELVDSVFVTATDTGAVPNVPLYVPGTTYQKSFLVRFTPASGQEAFYYSLQAGKLPAPVAVGDVNWKVVPGPVLPTALGQAITLAQAQNINGDTVVLGRAYAIELPQPSASGHQQLLSVVGIAEGWFASEGWLLVNNARTAIESIDFGAGTWKVKQYGGGGATLAQLAAKVDKEAGKTLYNDAMAVAAVGAAELQLLTTSSARVRTLKLTQPLTIARVIKDTNTDYLAYQVNYFNGTRWVAGTSRLTESAARADMTNLDYTSTPLPELLIQVVPFVAQDPSTVVLYVIKQ